MFRKKSKNTHHRFATLSSLFQKVFGLLIFLLRAFNAPKTLFLWCKIWLEWKFLQNLLRQLSKLFLNHILHHHPTPLILSLISTMIKFFICFVVCEGLLSPVLIKELEHICRCVLGNHQKYSFVFSLRKKHVGILRQNMYVICILGQKMYVYLHTSYLSFFLHKHNF